MKHTSWTLLSVLLVAACGGGGGAMTEEPDDDIMNPTVILPSSDFDAVLSVHRDIEETIPVAITLGGSLSGTANFEGSAQVARMVNRTSSDVTFIAYGTMEAEVNFQTGAVTADASNFFELDPDQYNETGVERSLGAIDGALNYTAELGASPTILLGLGQATGSVTRLDGTVENLDLDGGVTFFNDNADIITIQGPGSNGTEDLTQPFTSFALNGQRQ